MLYYINTTIYSINRRMCLPQWHRALPGQCGAGVSFKGKVSLSAGYEAWYGKKHSAAAMLSGKPVRYHSRRGFFCTRKHNIAVGRNGYRRMPP